MAGSNLELDIALYLADVPEVESVCVVRQGDLFTVNTIVGDVPEEVYDRIYEREGAIIDNFQNWHFDFNVRSRRGRPESEIMGSIVPTWRRSESSVPCLEPTSI